MALSKMFAAPVHKIPLLLEFSTNYMCFLLLRPLSIIYLSVPQGKGTGREGAWLFLKRSPVSPLLFLHQPASPILIPCELEGVLCHHTLFLTIWLHMLSSSDSGFLDSPKCVLRQTVLLQVEACL